MKIYTKNDGKGKHQSWEAYIDESVASMGQEGYFSVYAMGLGDSEDAALNDLHAVIETLRVGLPNVLEEKERSNLLRLN